MMLDIFLLFVCILASAVYSGAETGFYSLSRPRLEMEVRSGQRMAALLQRLIGAESALLITILIGNNLAIELSTHLGDSLLGKLVFEPLGLPVGAAREVLLALMLTPVLFLFAELLPKDLFRRRPHSLVRLVAPWVAFSRLVFWPLERLLSGLTFLAERAFGLDPEAATRLRGREAVLQYLQEGRRSGALPGHSEALAHNALRLRSIPILEVMRPWKEVVHLSMTDEAGARAQLSVLPTTSYSRIPVLDVAGKVAGYVHQIDVLSGEPNAPLSASLRPLPALDASMPVGRALMRLKASGRRLALVGSPEEPLGLVSLKDLVEEISGDLPAW